MQDNYSKYDGDIDEQFEDHAWDEMSKLLDKEMPVVAPIPATSNKRKYLLLLLLFLWIGTGIGWWMSTQYYQQQAGLDTSHKEMIVETEEQYRLKQQSQKTEAEAKQITSFDNKKAALTNSQTPNSQQQIDKKKPLTASKQNTFQATKSSSTTSKNTKTRNEKIFQETTLPPTGVNKKDNKENIETGIELEHLNVSDQQNTLESIDNQKYNIRDKNEILPQIKKQKEINTQSTNIILNKEKSKEKLSDALTQPVAMLDILNLNKIEHKKKNEEDLNKYIITSPTKTFWKPNTIALELGLHSKELGSIDGFSITGILQYKLKSSRWSFQTGLGYQRIAAQGRHISDLFYQKDAQVLEADNTQAGGGYDTEDIVDVIYVNPTVFAFDPNHETEELLNNGEIEQILTYDSYAHLHYLNLPIQLNYRLWAKLELDVGLNLSYLLGTTVGQPNGTNVNNFDLDRAYNFKNAYARENNNLRKFDVKTQVGATWYPKPFVGFGLKYNAGLTRVFPHLTAEKWSDYRNNSWQLSMLFKF